MDQLLFDRATGSIGPNTFARLETTRLLRSFRPAPHIRFDGGHKGSLTTGDVGRSSTSIPAIQEHTDLWAHQNGVNALALERHDGRM